MATTQERRVIDRDPTTVGHRAKFAVIIPSTNTAVERDYNLIAPDGVTFHVARMWIQQNMTSDADSQAALEQMRAVIDKAVHDVITCQPDHFIAGMSSETFVGGLEGNRQFVQRVNDMSGLAVTTGASATKSALDLFGAKKISVLTPYRPVLDVEVEKFYNDHGFEIAKMHGFGVPVSTAAAEIPEDEIRRRLIELDGPDVDALVQAGTNLSATRIADELERELGKPVVSINVACVWHALRAVGIDDRIPGFGRLLVEH